MVGVSKQAREALEARHASPESLVCGPVSRPGEPRVVFYRLNRKFVDDQRSVPKESGEIIYYTLSVGHHTGVIDCFGATHDCSREDYELLCGMLPEGSTCRYKMEGILRGGEITVAQEDVPKIDADLRVLVDVLGQGDAAEPQRRVRAWLEGFLGSIDAIKADRVVYMVGRELLP